MFPRSCKGNCGFHTIEFILKDCKECPEVYESKKPPLDVMVTGQGISYYLMMQNFYFEVQNWPKLVKIGQNLTKLKVRKFQKQTLNEVPLLFLFDLS